MRSLKTLVLASAVMALGITGCKKGDDAAAKKADDKSDCQKATDNLFALMKSDTSEMGQMMAKGLADQKPEELVKECEKEEKKTPGGAKCAAAAKSFEEFMKCEKNGKGGDEKAEPTEEKVEGKGEEKAPEEKAPEEKAPEEKPAE